MTVRSSIRSMLVVVLVLLAMPGTASAGEYAAPAFGQGCGGYNSGGRDAGGILYMPCGNYVRIVRTDGSSYVVSINESVSHIAPSPDGTYLYANTTVGPRRYTRQGNGSYARDGFTFQRPPGWAERGWIVCGWGIATDAYGKIYVSNGGWCPGNPNQILKYRPDGTLITAFGDFGIATKWYQCGNTNCVEWNRQGSVPGSFQPNMMVAVTRDGGRVWVADQNNQRVQVFERAADNIGYQYRAMWSGEDTPYDGQAGAIYGVAVDEWGYGYASLTTAKVLYRLDPDARNPVLVAGYAGSDAVARPHTIAVDARGAVWVGEWGARIDRSVPYSSRPALGAEPRPDLAVPTISAVTAPGETTAGSVSVGISASDDIGVTELRLADEAGEWRGWRPFATQLDVPLSDGVGTKVIYVQVRDAAGRISDAKWTIVQRRPVPDTADPTVQLTAPATSTSSTATVTITASDDVAVTHIRFATEEGTFSDWQPWASGTRTIEHPLTSGLGARIVAVQVRDAAYRISQTAQATILVEAPRQPDPVPPLDAVAGGGLVADRVAPRIGAIVVPRRSCTRRIVLRLAASDDTGVRLVRTANEDGRFGGWRAYAPRLVHTLSRGATRKVVYVQVRDAAGNISNLVARRTVVVRCP